MELLQRCWIAHWRHWARLSLWPSLWCWSSVVLGASQESRAQPVVLRQERRAAPRDPPVMHSGMRLGWSPISCVLGSHHLPSVAAWWRGTSMVFMLVRSWAWRLFSQKHEQKPTLLCSEGDCIWDLPFLQGELLAPIKPVLGLDLAELGFLFLGFTSSARQ